MALGRLRGSFRPPGDKSISHRLALFSLLTHGDLLVTGFSPCADCQSSLEAVAALGGHYAYTDQGLYLHGAGGCLAAEGRIDCGNSGTTMRLLAGLLAGGAGRYVLDGDDSLRRRPMERVAMPLRAMGASVETTGGKPPVTITGGDLCGIDYPLPVASAQLKSALMLAGLRATGLTRITEPAPSRDHTERLFAMLGTPLECVGSTWLVRSGLLTVPAELAPPVALPVPGDASGAAFFLCAAAMLPGSRVTATEVNLNPTRLGWLEVLKRMGAQVEITPQGEHPEPWGEITVTAGARLVGTEVTAAEIPFLVDEVPILSLLATQAEGRTVFREVGELRVKECDRLGAMVSELGPLGAQLEIVGEDLVVTGPTPLTPTDKTLAAYHDHRVAMTLGIAGLVCGETLTVDHPECAGVSYPDFYQHLEALRA